MYTKIIKLTEQCTKDGHCHILYLSPFTLINGFIRLLRPRFYSWMHNINSPNKDSFTLKHEHRVRSVSCVSHLLWIHAVPESVTLLLVSVCVKKDIQRKGVKTWWKCSQWACWCCCFCTLVRIWLFFYLFFFLHLLIGEQNWNLQL